MTIKNNYNSNKDGISIQFIGHYDSDLSQIQFNDSTQILSRNRRGEVDLLYFNNFDTNIEIKDLLKSTEKSIKYLNDEFDLDSIDELAGSQALEILQAVIDNNIDAFILNPDFDTMVSRGYSQGDCVKVIYKKSDLALDCNLKTFIDRILWDSPIYCYVEINGAGYYPEFVDDYIYDKQQVIDSILKQVNDEKTIIDGLKDELIKIVPETISYE